MLDEQRWTDPTEIAEAFRYVGQVLSASSEPFWEGDLDHPRFASIVSPARKLQGDNPDAIYHFARIRGDRTYRVRGRIREQCYACSPSTGRPRTAGWPARFSVTETIAISPSPTTARTRSSSAQHPTTATGSSCIPTRIRSSSARTTNCRHRRRTTPRSMSTSISGPTIKRRHHRSTTRRSPHAWRKVAFLRTSHAGAGRAVGRTVARAVRLQHPQRRRHTVRFRDSGLPVRAADIFYSMGRWDAKTTKRWS